MICSRRIQLVGRYTPGFTLIEAMVFLFIFSVITMAFYETWRLGLEHILNARNRLGATAVVNQQMEIVRGLTFDDIGTTAGIPTGVLSATQTISASNATYTIQTVVQFVDDSTDGTLGHGDLAPNDYKKVTITASWGAGGPSREVSVTSLFSLDGVESVAAGTGILSINVLDTAGNGITAADIRVVNTAVSPSIDFPALTDATGNSAFPGAPASVQKYQLTVTKSGYYPNRTYDPYPISAFNPVNTHATVVAGSLTATTLVTDRTSTIELASKDPFGTDIPDIDFGITGGLIIGTDPGSGANVFDYTDTLSTDSSGESTLADRSTGEYTVTLDAGETGYRFLRLDPEEATFGTINLLPNVTKTVTMVLADKAFSSALVTVTNASDGSPVAGAAVHLTNGGLGYDTTVTTDTYGQAFFPTSATPLVAGTYDAEISAPSFDTKTGNMVIGGSALESKTFTLTPS